MQSSGGAALSNVTLNAIAGPGGKFFKAPNSNRRLNPQVMALDVQSFQEEGIIDFTNCIFRLLSLRSKWCCLNCEQDIQAVDLMLYWCDHFSRPHDLTDNLLIPVARLMVELYAVGNVNIVIDSRAAALAYAKDAILKACVKSISDVVRLDLQALIHSLQIWYQSQQEPHQNCLCSLAHHASDCFFSCRQRFCCSSSCKRAHQSFTPRVHAADRSHAPTV